MILQGLRVHIFQTQIVSPDLSTHIYVGPEALPISKGVGYCYPAIWYVDVVHPVRDPTMLRTYYM
jgi:hypothetical protein